MKVEACLEKLLRNLDPQLQGDVYVFCSLPEARLLDLIDDCLCVFREREGLSAILTRTLAEREGLASSGGFRQITLQVYSSLEAVGLTAAVTAELASWGISANVVAALRHDHVFVPEEEAEEALRLLRGISSRAQYS
ncbi:ACT domain-containing protein [Microbulbifer thermotolerans]|uniref:ACT domain-containing protein n=1 Tax=Microbulbifer thermotolerans TaxID=252514 RepID=UPI00267276CB|nr:ACT domain-containing protein [Microbulbifer thermotolerans]WKT60684.1 ACT domain-containing protein [Microbulbifer thermotolerans]